MKNTDRIKGNVEFGGDLPKQVFVRWNASSVDERCLEADEDESTACDSAGGNGDWAVGVYKLVRVVTMTRPEPKIRTKIMKVIK